MDDGVCVDIVVGPPSTLHTSYPDSKNREFHPTQQAKMETSSLFHLSAELRNHIYEVVVTSTDPIIVKESAASAWSPKHSQQRVTIWALAHTCRAIRVDCLGMLYANKHSVFKTSTHQAPEIVLSKFGAHIGAANHSFVQAITLDLGEFVAAGTSTVGTWKKYVDLLKVPRAETARILDISFFIYELLSYRADCFPYVCSVTGEPPKLEVNLKLSDVEELKRTSDEWVMACLEDGGPSAQEWAEVIRVTKEASYICT